MDPVLVEIVSIQPVAIRRRLLSGGVDIVTSIMSSNQDIQSLANIVSGTTFALSLGGVVFNMTPFDISSTGGVTILNNVELTSTPRTDEITIAGGNIVGLIVGVTFSVIFSLLLFLLIVKKCTRTHLSQDQDAPEVVVQPAHVDNAKSSIEPMSYYQSRIRADPNGHYFTPSESHNVMFNA